MTLIDIGVLQKIRKLPTTKALNDPGISYIYFSGSFLGVR